MGAARLSSPHFFETGNLLVATVTLGRALVLGLVAADAECVALFEVPFFVCREVGIFVACVAPNVCLVLGVLEHRRPLAGLGR